MHNIMQSENVYFKQELIKCSRSNDVACRT